MIEMAHPQPVNHAARTSSPAAATTALPSLDPDLVRWSSAAAVNLKIAGFEAVVRSSFLDGAKWFLGTKLAFRPTSDPRPLEGEAAEKLVEIISSHETLIGEIEQATGLAAEFADYAPLPYSAPVIDVARSGASLCKIVVRAQVLAHHSSNPPTLLPLRFQAARLPLLEAQKLAAGDMLVLERGPWLLIDCPAAISRQPLALDPTTGRLGNTLDQPMTNPSADAATIDETGALTVPVAVQLADVAVTQDELSAMIERGAFDLGQISEGLTVTLAVGGRRIGGGEIVRLGDRFAVLLDGNEQSLSTQAHEGLSEIARNPDIPAESE